MPAWLTIYCRRPVTITRSELLYELRGADFDTLAEVHEIDESLVEPAVDALRLEDTSHDALDGASFAYRAPDFRPIQIHEWTSPERVAEEIEETRDADDVPEEVDAALDEVVAVIALELGFGMYEDMGIVFAWEIARLLAHAARGFVRDDDHRWSLVDERGGYVHLGE